jgi:ABC-2 type transport system ATP-binding protein
MILKNLSLIQLELLYNNTVVLLFFFAIIYLEVYMIEIKNLTKVYNHDKKAVDNLNLTIKDGEIFAFIGHNGAGKTTTIKCMMGILDIDEGDILINGTSIKTDPIKCKAQMAYLSDNPDLYENLTANEYLNFIADMYSIPLKERKDRIVKYATRLEIIDNLNQDLSSFSHGMKQKVALISALVHDPQVLVMDEPFVGLDPSAIFTMKEIMKEMCKENKIIFFSTHILDVAEKLCDEVGIIKNGHLIKKGTMKEVKGDSSLEDVFLELDKENSYE